MAESPPANRRLAHAAVEAAIRAIAGTSLKTQADSMLRVLLAFRALHAHGAPPEVDTAALRDVVGELFTVLPTPDGVSDKRFKGTLQLRGSQGGPSWMNNDSYRGSFEDYAGPTSVGRHLFEDENWRNNVRGDAVETVAGTLGKNNKWPPRDAVAAVALRNRTLDSALGWDEISDLARQRFGLTPEEWTQITSPPTLEVEPFDGPAWDPDKLSSDLRHPGAEHASEAEHLIEGEPPHLADAVKRVLDALDKYGNHAIVALAGVPGTSKSHVGRRAAAAYASEGCLREIQFSPGYSYEEFIEGPRFKADLDVEVVPGAFLELSDQALVAPDKQYVLLIEEFSRADLPKVLGELLTYVEYRKPDDEFTTMYRRDKKTRVAPNLAILATYNPADRSAVAIDAAIIRRLRILNFPPDLKFLREILAGNGVDGAVIDALEKMFEACRQQAGPDRFEEVMPFGHAVFSHVETEKDLYEIWHSELKHILVRPHTPPHELYETIRDQYPWRSAATVSVVAHPPQDAASGNGEGAVGDDDAPDEPAAASGGEAGASAPPS